MRNALNDLKNPEMLKSLSSLGECLHDELKLIEKKSDGTRLIPHLESISFYSVLDPCRPKRRLATPTVDRSEYAIYSLRTEFVDGT